MAENEISRDGISLYDRQIRVWGVDGQIRLQAARVLIVGLGGVAVEVVKNLVLGGVGALTLQDEGRVIDADLAVNFFVRPEDLGLNRAKATARGARALNPRVAVEANAKQFSDVHDHYFTEFDVVIAVDQALVELQRIDRVVHNAGNAFYATGSMGWAGYIFADLAKHTFVVERPVSDEQFQTGSVSPTRSILDVATKDDGKTVVLKVQESYKSLSDVLREATHTPFGSTVKPRELKRVSPYLPALLAMWDSPSLSSADIESKAKSLGLPDTVVDREWGHEFATTSAARLPAIDSVVGGYLAQDTINFLTRKDYTLQNLFIYDSLHESGPVYRL